MSDSTIHIDKSCVFRETFNSSFDVYKNSGTISTSGVIVENGVALFKKTSNQYISYNLNKNLTKSSIRLIVRLFGNNLNSRILGNAQSSAMGIEIYTHPTTGNITTSTGTLYINGLVNNSFNPKSGEWFEIVVTLEFSRNYKIAWLGNYNYNTIRPINGEISNFEIYNKVLTKYEIKLLYQKKMYSKIIIPNNNLLLDFDATNGLLVDKSGKNNLIINNVEPKKIGSIYAAYFSSINTNGSYISTKEKILKPIKTILFWAKVDKYYVDNYFGITSGSISLRFSSSINYTILSLGGVGYINNTNSNIIAKPNNFNLYVIKYNTIPPTNNILQIGYKFKGYLTKFRVYDIYLSNEQIQQIYNSEKQQFGL